MLLVVLFASVVAVLEKCGAGASLISTQTELCGPDTDVELGENEDSSAVVELTTNGQTGICKLRISAPSSHVVYMQFVDTVSEMHREFLAAHSPSNRPCMLSVFQKENRKTPVWKGDPCSNDPPAEVDLLNPQITIEWSPPADSAHTKGRKLLLTAVGQGEVCNKKGQHTCMTIGHEPLFCVSNYLVCNGNNNCPKGATKSDEDEKVCKIPLTFFTSSSIVVDFLRNFKPSEFPQSNFLNALKAKATEAPRVVDNRWTDWKSIEKPEEITQPPVEEKSVSAIESFSIALSHYGPWGYIMLGMLICGTVLMFCGVWECLRKPKPSTEPLQTTPTPVLTVSGAQQEENRPPRYDDIDPPSYTTLFPDFKLDNPTGEVAGSESNDEQGTGSALDESQANSSTSDAGASANDETVIVVSEET